MSRSTEYRVDTVEERQWEQRVRDAAREYLQEHCSYWWYFSHIEMHFRAGVLTLCGTVPSYYLKQILQTFLTKVDEVQRIDNQVNVISSTGLSSANGHKVSDKCISLGDARRPK